MNLIKIGNYIMTKRKELTLTQEQLAEKVGVSSKTISKWECGKSLPDHNIIELLCNVLKITTSELINGEDNSKIDDKQNIEGLKTYTNDDYTRALIANDNLYRNITTPVIN